MVKINTQNEKLDAIDAYADGIPLCIKLNVNLRVRLKPYQTKSLGVRKDSLELHLISLLELSK